MNNVIKLLRDIEYMGGGFGSINDLFGKKDDTYESKELLIKLMMDRCGITSSDLADISIVRSKLRESKINELI